MVGLVKAALITSIVPSTNVEHSEILDHLLVLSIYHICHFLG